MQSSARVFAVVCVVLLLAFLLYAGSYFALVIPGAAMPYRGIEGGRTLFWPLEQLDRKVRPGSWAGGLPHYDGAAVPQDPILVPAAPTADLAILAKNPGVANVEHVLPGEPAIIHVLDWHYVSKEALANAEGLNGRELDAEHAKVLMQAGAVHKSKLLILADLPEVFQEGLTDGNQVIVAAEIKSLAAYHTLLRRDGGDDLDHERTLLRLGAAAELLLDGKSIKLLPAEGDEHELGKSDKLGDETNRARETAILKRIVKRGNTAWLILGGGHDLTELVREHEGWGYVRITPKGYPE